MLKKDPNDRCDLYEISECDWLTKSGRQHVNIEITGLHDIRKNDPSEGEKRGGLTDVNV